MTTVEQSKKEKRNVVVRWLAEDLPHVDPDYGRTIVKSLYRFCGTKLRAEIIRRQRADTIQRAKQNYQPSNQNYGWLVSRYNSLNEEFKILEALLKNVRTSLREFAEQDLLRETEHGKRAVDLAQLNIGLAYDGVLLAWDANTAFRPKMDAAIAEVKARTGAPATDVPIDAEIDRERVEFEALCMSVLADTHHMLHATRDDLNQALEFETFKAYAKKNPDKLSKAAKQSEQVASNLVGAIESSASVVPVETAKKVMESAHAIANVLVAFSAKAARSAAAGQQVKAIMASPEKRRAALAYLDDPDNCFVVAEYLADKYIRTIQINLDTVDILVFGAQAGASAALEATGFGTLVAKALSVIWEAVKSTIIAVVKGIRKARIAAAVKKMNKAKPAEGAMGVAAESVLGEVRTVCAELLTESPERMLETVKEMAKTNVFKLLSPTSVAQEGLMTAVTMIVEKTMVRLEVTPAQAFTGQDLLAMLSRNSQQTQLGAALDSVS